MNSQIIETASGRYQYVDRNGKKTDIDFLEADSDTFGGVKMNSIQIFRIGDNYGISKNHSVVVADPYYSEIYFLRDSDDDNINFKYTINIKDSEGNNLYIYGVNRNGRVFQDSSLYESDNTRNYIKYNIEVPDSYVFIILILQTNSYFRLDKNGIFDITTFPLSDSSKAPYTSYMLKKGEYICLINDSNCGYSSKRYPVKKWYLYSHTKNCFCYVNELHSPQYVKRIAKCFYIYEQEGFCGILGPSLETLAPLGKYISFDFKKNRMDFIIAFDKYGACGVLELCEKQEDPFWQLNVWKRDCFFKKYYYKESLPLKYKMIRRCDNFFVLYDFGNKQCIYSIIKRQELTPYFSSGEWIVDPETLGENLVGAHAKSDSSREIVFLDTNTGEIAIKLPPHTWIERGFFRGKAIIRKFRENSEYYIDKEGHLDLIESVKYYDYSPSESDGNPYDEYTEEEKDNFYGLTDGMYGDLD